MLRPVLLNLINTFAHTCTFQGNVLELSNGKLGLIDYGQTRRLSTSDRLSFARIVSALSKDPMNATEVSEAMRACGFVTKHSKDEITAKYASSILRRRFRLAENGMCYAPDILDEAWCS